MNIGELIKDIQEQNCLNCPYGKCLVALRDLKEATCATNGNNASHTVTERKLQKKTAIPKARKVTHSAIGAKRCNGCGKTLAIKEFPKNKTCRGGYAGTCKECCYARAKRHAAAKNSASSKHTPAAPAAAAGIIRCKLCDYRAIDLDRLASHMRTSHGAQSI
jgi:hypothetical protein